MLQYYSLLCQWEWDTLMVRRDVAKIKSDSLVGKVSVPTGKSPSTSDSEIHRTTGLTRLGRCCRAVTRETAALYAFSAAGVTHGVARACAAGRLRDCHCAEASNAVETRQTWKWGGCGDNLSHGRAFAAKFLDAGPTRPVSPTPPPPVLRQLFRNENEQKKNEKSSTTNRLEEPTDDGEFCYSIPLAVWLLGRKGSWRLGQQICHFMINLLRRFHFSSPQKQMTAMRALHCYGVRIGEYFVLELDIV